MTLCVARTLPELENALAALRANGETLGFVPTMGALHDGHMSLVEAAKRSCDHVAVSIFVNPAQFADGEDFSIYPRTLDADLRLLEEGKADLVFVPEAAEIYPPGFSTLVEVKALGEVLCGAHRTGHFTGVATVVAVLLQLFRPTRAFFGEKDYQQYLIIKRLQADLHLSGEISSVPTLREPDGLALSSRNRYLSEAERRIAPRLFEIIHNIKNNLQSIDDKETFSSLLVQGTASLRACGFDRVDYLEIRHGETLALPPENERDWRRYRIFAAVRLGQTRLIDNLPLAG